MYLELQFGLLDNVCCSYCDWVLLNQIGEIPAKIIMI